MKINIESQVVLDDILNWYFENFVQSFTSNSQFSKQITNKRPKLFGMDLLLVEGLWKMVPAGIELRLELDDCLILFHVRPSEFLRLISKQREKIMWFFKARFCCPTNRFYTNVSCGLARICARNKVIKWSIKTLLRLQNL